MKILIVIPARGGSKGIPRKNLRPLNGVPLIGYSIQTALKSKFKPDVVVSSEDEEILFVAGKLGAQTHRRDPSYSQDVTPLDPVIYSAMVDTEKAKSISYDIVITMQPTSPLLKTQTLDRAIEFFIAHPEFETVISGKDDTHLTWSFKDEKYVPNFSKRLNRQLLTPTFKETGGFFISRRNIVELNSRIGKSVSLFPLPAGEDIDIDTFEHWNLCEYFLKRKKILFVITGNKEVGLGHAYNCLEVASEIMNHDVYFLTDKNSEMAYQKIKSHFYPVAIQQSADIVDDILSQNPDLVINDILDTNANYIKTLKQKGLKVINFEDLGEGAKEADLVFNPIYPEKERIPNHYFGYQYFILRNEFYFSKPHSSQNPKKILLTYGGVDPNNLTEKVLSSIYDTCMDKNIEINVVAGFGYNKYDTLKKYPNIKIHKNTPNISSLIEEADIAFTSAGRTIFEVACVGVPTIVIAQNERELTHLFANKDNGFLHLGLHSKVSVDSIQENFLKILNNKELRQEMSQAMLSKDLKHGKKRVIDIILALLEK